MLEKTKIIVALIFKFNKQIKICFGILVASVLFFNAAFQYSSIYKVMNAEQKHKTKLNKKEYLKNLFSVISLETQKNNSQYQEFKSTYNNQNKAGHMYGAKFSNKGGPLAVIHNYFQILKIKKGVNNEFNKISKELDYQNQRN